MDNVVQIDEADIDAFIMQKESHERYHLLIDASLFENLIADICNVNAFCTKRWLWEGTLLDEHKASGPLLVRFDTCDDPLLDFFISGKDVSDRAIFFISGSSLEEIMEHLRNRLFAFLPDGSKAMIRIFDPRKLSGVINSLSLDKLEYLFRPLGKLLWREHCFDITRNLVLHIVDTNDKSILSELSINEKELESIDKHSIKRFIQTMARMLVAKHSVEEEKAEEIAIRYSRKAYSYNIDTEKDIEEYISISIENHDLMNSPMMDSILSQDETSRKKIILMKNYIDYCEDGELAHA